jgi:hypothetical protein
MRTLLLFLVPALLWGERPPDVRKVNWGMTRAEVMAAESGSPTAADDATLRYPITDDDATLRYPVTDLAQAAAAIEYRFANGRLVRATYIFLPKHADANDFVADFHAVTAALIANHKKPSCEHARWLDDSLQAERLAYLEQDRALPSDVLPSDALAGLSIALGHLELYSTWNGPRTQILHTMVGADHRIAHRVEYRSVELFASDQPADALQPAQICR